MVSVANGRYPTELRSPDTIRPVIDTGSGAAVVVSLYDPAPLGGWEGKVRMADDFDETPAEVPRL
jgi:hypothetical protein